MLGGYNVDVISEVKNAAFGAGSSSVPGSTLRFLDAIAMFEGGLFDSVKAVCQPHQISAAASPERVVHALRRGKQGKQDLLAIDCFSIADQPLVALQEAWSLKD